MEEIKKARNFEVTRCLCHIILLTKKKVVFTKVINIEEQKELSPEEISTMILIKMKQIAENYLGQEINNAVITVPATSMTHKDQQQRMQESLLD